MPRALAIVLALCACSGPLSGQLSFPPNVQASGGTVIDGGFVTNLVVLMANFDQPGTSCAQQLSGALSGQSVTIRMWNSDGSIVIPASYAIGGPQTGSLAAVTLTVTYPDGGSRVIATAASGSVSLSNIRSVTLGTFTAAMVLADGGAGGQLNGSFDPGFCGG